MWMNGDVEMAIDAYRVWLQTKMDWCDRTPGVGVETFYAFSEALEAFDVIFKAGEEDGEHPEDSQPNVDMGDYIYDPVAKIWWHKESLEERVAGVAERIDVDSEEIEQDVRDAVEAAGDKFVCDSCGGEVKSLPDYTYGRARADRLSTEDTIIVPRLLCEKCIGEEL